MLKTLLIELEDKMKELNPFMHGLLNPPIGNTTGLNTVFEQAFDEPITLSADLITLYGWHDGTVDLSENDNDPSVKKGYLANELFFCSAEEVLKSIQLEDFYDFKNDLQLPIFTSFNGEFLALNLKGEGFLVYCSTSDFEIDTKVTMYDSITSFVETTIEFYKQDMYEIDEDGILQLNFDKYDKYMEIGERMNPKSDYWRVKREFQEGA